MTSSDSKHSVSQLWSGYKLSNLRWCLMYEQGLRCHLIIELLVECKTLSNLSFNWNLVTSQGLQSEAITFMQMNCQSVCNCLCCLVVGDTGGCAIVWFHLGIKLFMPLIRSPLTQLLHVWPVMSNNSLHLDFLSIVYDRSSPLNYNKIQRDVCHT